MVRLDQNRAQTQLALKAGVDLTADVMARLKALTDAEFARHLVEDCKAAKYDAPAIDQPADAPVHAAPVRAKKKGGAA